MNISTSSFLYIKKNYIIFLIYIYIMIVIPLYDLGEIKYNNLSKFFIKIDNKFIIEFCLKSLDLERNSFF